MISFTKSSNKKVPPHFELFPKDFKVQERNIVEDITISTALQRQVFFMCNCSIEVSSPWKTDRTLATELCGFWGVPQGQVYSYKSVLDF